MTIAYWVAGMPSTSDEVVSVVNPYDGVKAGSHYLPSTSDIEKAVAAAAEASNATKSLPAHARAAALDHVAHALSGRADEFAALITAESGKPIKWARAEVERAASTFRLAGEETRRYSGELQRLDTNDAGTGRIAMVRRVPKGPILGITPFNFPINLVAHKVAPAIAVGAPILLKPAPATPLTALALGAVLAETDLPSGSWSILPTGNEDAAKLVNDQRLPVVSFTGSVPVGWGIAEAAPRKHIALELGGNAAVIVCPDWVDLDGAATRIATFAMYQAGQSCVSVQRVYAHKELYERLAQRVVDKVRELGTGDPRDPHTDVGPLIDEKAAKRVSSWVENAVLAGASLRTGGQRNGASITPTVLTGVPEDTSVMAEEVFGPVVCLNQVDSVDEAVELTNDSRFGLQTGVFTTDIPTAFGISSDLDVGGVIIGDVPSFRADQMPYGGVKDSGVGREGPRSAMDDFTDTRVTVLTGLAL